MLRCWVYRRSLSAIDYQINVAPPPVDDQGLVFIAAAVDI
jgi:hypothetical protein